jgi:integrase
MAIYKRTKKNGKTVYDLVYYDDQGKQKWKTYPTKKEAEDHEARARVAKRENNYQEIFKVKPECTTTFNELAEKYTLLYQDQTCWRDSKAHVVKALVQEFGHRKLAQITRLELEEWRKKRLKRPDGTPREQATVDHDMTVFRHMLAKAKEWTLLQASPFDTGSSLFYRPDNARKGFFTDEQLGTLLDACPPELGLIIDMACRTGLRLNEILNMEWAWVDFKAGLITIPGHCMKGKKAHRVPIIDHLAGILRELRRANQLRSPFVFVNEQGQRIRDYQVRRSLKRAMQKAGLVYGRKKKSGLTFHDTRHTFASHLVMNGADLVTVSSLLGHADISTTMRYAHLSQEHRKAAVNLLNGLPGIRQTLDKIESK